MLAMASLAMMPKMVQCSYLDCILRCLTFCCVLLSVFALQADKGAQDPTSAVGVRSGRDDAAVADLDNQFRGVSVAPKTPATTTAANASSSAAAAPSRWSAFPIAQGPPK